MPLLRVVFVLALLVGVIPAHAYVRTMSSSGRPLFWSNPTVTVRANPSNISGLTAGEIDTLLANAFGSWRVSGSGAGFQYFQSPSYPAASNADGVNSVYFASASGRNMDYGVVALTEVLYFISNGQIAEADMAFNDNQFRFTAVEGDTGKVIGGKTAIFLRDVATHEAGHALGIDHSIVNHSSLIYTAFSGQYKLSGDDVAAARTIYPGGFSGAALTGSVMGTKGGIFGAHIAAINLETGTVEAGALANSDGSFRVGDIPSGPYAVMMEPFGAEISSISSYYQNVDHRFCGFSNFRRRFYSACGSQGAASVINLSSGSVDLGTLSPSCSSMGNPGGPPNSIANARELPASGGAAWGQMRPGETHYYVVHNVRGALKARAMSYSLYSPVDVKVQILTSSGGALTGATSVDNVEDPGAGGVVNYDSSAAANVAMGDYVLQVTSGPSRIPSSKYSAGFDLLDTDGHYLLALSVDGSFGPTSLNDMSSCISVSNRVQNANFREFLADKESKPKSSGCGTLHTPSGGGPWDGGITQVFLTAFAVKLLSLTLRFRRRRSG